MFVMNKSMKHGMETDFLLEKNLLLSSFSSFSLPKKTSFREREREREREILREK